MENEGFKVAVPYAIKINSHQHNPPIPLLNSGQNECAATKVKLLPYIFACRRFLLYFFGNLSLDIFKYDSNHFLLAAKMMTNRSPRQIRFINDRLIMQFSIYKAFSSPLFL